MNIKRLIIRSILFLFLLPVSAFLFIYLNYHIISFISADRIYSNPDLLPNKGYALVLGAGNYEPEQWENHSFEHRMDATYELYAKGIIDTLIVSGLSLPGVYNEAEEMKSYLVNKGMPASAIILDSLGVRTWVSVERMKDPFHINNFIIISQEGQLERAVFSARFMQLDAVGFVAEPTHRFYRYWLIREYLARVKCLADCFAYVFKIS